MWRGYAGSVGVAVVKEGVSSSEMSVYGEVDVCGGVLLDASRVLFASPDRPGEARSYLARALAAVSHTLHAPLPGGEGRRERMMVMCVCVSCQ